MDVWREKAAEVLPELLEEITTAESPMNFWMEISLRLEDSYSLGTPNDDLIARIYKFAFWCLNQPQTNSPETDPSSAVAVSFIENIPLHPRTAEDAHRWLTIDDFEGFESLFRYHLEDDQYAKFRADFFTRKNKFG